MFLALFATSVLPKKRDVKMPCLKCSGSVHARMQDGVSSYQDYFCGCKWQESSRPWLCQHKRQPAGGGHALELFRQEDRPTRSANKIGEHVRPTFFVGVAHRYRFNLRKESRVAEICTETDVKGSIVRERNPRSLPMLAVASFVARSQRSRK